MFVRCFSKINCMTNLIILFPFHIFIPGECTDECVCHGFNYLSQEIVDDLCSLSKYNEQCPVTCKTCHTKTTTTLAPKVTTEPKTATPKTTAKPTTAKPTTAKPTTAKPTTAKPTTAKPTTTKSTTTATPKTDGPVDGGLSSLSSFDFSIEN